MKTIVIYMEGDVINGKGDFIKIYFQKSIFKIKLKEVHLKIMVAKTKIIPIRNVISIQPIMIHKKLNGDLKLFQKNFQNDDQHKRLLLIIMKTIY